jgi:hypothetical protein
MPKVQWVPILLAALLFFGLALWDQSKLQHPFFKYFRIFFPSWRFFNQRLAVPVAWIRLNWSADSLDQVSHPRDWIHWKQLPTFPSCPTLSSPGGLLSLLINPRGNLGFALQSLLEQLVMDLNDWEEERSGSFSHCPSYQMMSEAIRVLLQDHPEAEKILSFQFKVNLFNQDALETRTGPCHSQDVLLSEELTLTPTGENPV